MREAGDSLLDDLSNKLPWTTAVHFDHWTNISWAVQTNSVARCCLYIQAFPLQTTVALISTANGFHSFKVWVICQPTHLMGDMSSVGNARPPKIPWTPPGVSYDGAAGLASSDAVDINGLRVCPHNSWDRHPSYWMVQLQYESPYGKCVTHLMVGASPSQ